MTTGQALYALVPDREPSVRGTVNRGVAYLLATQLPDGSWKVPSRLTSSEPTEGKDYVYGVWGTAWASIGLSRKLD